MIIVVDGTGNIVGIAKDENTALGIMINHNDKK